MIRTNRAIATSAAGFAALLALAACGSKTVSPQQQLDNSFGGLANGSSLTTTIRLVLSPTDLDYFASLPNDDGSSDSPATIAREKKLLPTSSIVISASTDNGKPLKSLGQDSKDENVSFALNLGGKSDVEFRTLGKSGVLYARADVNDLAAQFGEDASKVQAATANVPQSLSFVKPALAGGWISLDLTSLEALAKQFPGTTAGTPSANPSQAAAAEAQLVDSLERDVTATQGPSSNLGNQLILTANSKAVVTDLVNAVKAAVPSALSSTYSKELNLSQVPSQPVTIDAFTKNGELSALQIDLAQFVTGTDAAKVKGHHIPLEIDFSSAGTTIAAPATSTPLNLQQIISAFTSVGGSSS